MAERDSDHVPTAATTGKADLAQVPLEYWRSRFEIRDNAVVWRPKPRETFPTEGEWRAWNERYAGKQPGGVARDGSVRLRDLGCYASLVKIRIVLETGVWPGRYHLHDGIAMGGPYRVLAARPIDASRG